MKHSMILFLCMAAPAWTQSTAETLDKMIAAGKSPQELAAYVFDTHGCKDCHTAGKDGKLGFTRKGEERAQGSQGCIATLKAMTVIAKIPANQRSETRSAAASWAPRRFPLRGVTWWRTWQEVVRGSGTAESGGVRMVAWGGRADTSRSRC